jgi:hypothetical protein
MLQGPSGEQQRIFAIFSNNFMQRNKTDLKKESIKKVLCPYLGHMGLFKCVCNILSYKRKLSKRCCSLMAKKTEANHEHQTKPYNFLMGKRGEGIQRNFMDSFLSTQNFRSLIYCTSLYFISFWFHQCLVYYF